MAVLSEIWIYPVKSLPGIRLNSAVVNQRGFEWDRHWMLVNTDGTFVTQREKPEMALFSVRIEKDHLIIGSPGKQDLHIGLHETNARQMKVKVWNDAVNADLVSDEACNWFSDCLGEPLSLVKMPETEVRQVDQAYAQTDDQTGFSDGFPFLLLSQASIDDLNDKIEDKTQQMTVERFRPNLVVSDVAAYAEDQWRSVKINDITFRVVKPCSRCAITTVNPETGSKGTEPLQTLAKYRREGNKVFFGQNVIHDSQGLLKQGDLLSVLA